MTSLSMTLPQSFAALTGDGGFPLRLVTSVVAAVSLPSPLAVTALSLPWGWAGGNIWSVVPMALGDSLSAS